MVAPPSLPFDQFPIIVRLVGRPLLGQLWQDCFKAGVEAGEAIGFLKGLAIGMLGTLTLSLLLLVVFLAVFHAARSRR